MAVVLNQLLFFAFFQCLFLLVIFTISSRKRQRVNLFLWILIITLMVGLIGKVGQISLDWQRQMKGLSELSILFFGPTVYLFVRSTLSEKQYARLDLWHYIPGLIYGSFVLFYYVLPPPEVITERYLSGELLSVVRVLVGSGLIVNSIYFVLAIIEYRKLSKALKDEASYVLNINFVRNFLLAIGACFLIWWSVYLISVSNQSELEIVTREFIWLAVALIVLLIAYYQMVSPTVFQFKSLSKTVKYAQSKFTSADLDQLKLKLEQIMLEKKPYLNSKLLKSELAELMEINAPELSRLLNERIGMSFFEYINYHRIHEFIRLAKTSMLEQKTLLGLAQEAGFHSKSTFNKSFKQIMGCPPSEYLKKTAS